jgi:hypothetical protein
LIEGDRCPACRARIAPDQRYCLECGERLVSLGPPVARLFKQPGAPLPRRTVRVPGPKMGAFLTASALGMGLFIGSALDAGSGVTNVAAGSPSWPSAAAPSGGETLGPPTLAAAVGNTAAANPPAAPAAGAAVPAPAPSAPVVASVPSVPTVEPTAPNQGAGKGGKGGSGQGQSATGVVVHVNFAAHSYSLASGGPLLPIHAAKLPAPGAKLEVPIEPLVNGTFAEAGQRSKKGKAKTASFSGTVTSVDPQAATYTVSARGASVLVHVQPATPQAAQLPGLGALVTVGVTIAEPETAATGAPPAGTATPPAETATPPAGTATPPTGTAAPPTATPTPPAAPPSPAAQPPPCPAPPAPIVPAKPSAVQLWQTGLQIAGQASGPVDLEGIVQASCPAPRQLLLSADDIREGAQDLTLGSADPGIEFSRVLPGQPIDVTAALGADGSYLITGLAGDQGRKGADDPSTGQGDQATR